MAQKAWVQHRSWVLSPVGWLQSLQLIPVSMILLINGIRKKKVGKNRENRVVPADQLPKYNAPSLHNLSYAERGRQTAGMPAQVEKVYKQGKTVFSSTKNPNALL